MDLQKRIATDPAIPIAAPGVAGYSHVTTHAGIARRLRTWVLTAFIFLVPLVTYWPATFHDFGLRDDYSNLREAHEEPGKIIQFCASHARPIYGWLLQSTYGQTSSVQNLQWMRLFASLLLGALSYVCFRALRSLGWSFSTSLCFAVLLALVPAAQVIAGWAVGWPYAATALLAIGGFFTVEGALIVGMSAGPARAAGQWIIALGLMVGGALIYQPSAFFYLVPLAAALIAQRDRSPVQTARWVGIHLGFVVATLGMAYCTMSMLYAAGVFVKSGRIAFEQHWANKALWFLEEPLPNALSLFVLNDNNQRDHFLFIGCAVLVGGLLLAGAYLEWRRHGRSRGLVWLTGLVGLPVFACSVSLIASEHYATYRTILAMTAILLVFLIASMRSLTENWGPSARRMLATVAISIAFFSAQHHAYALIAVPQGNEWRLIMAGAKQVHLNPHYRPRIFAIASSPADISTASIYHDEFGSLSSNSEWVPTEMFKRAMHDLYPAVPNLDTRYEFSTGKKLPATQRYDVIIDLHRLRQYYTDN